MNNIELQLPPLLTKEHLKREMTKLPEYNESIRESSSSSRLMKLSDLYDIYIPSVMSTEIYTKMYLATFRSLQKKYTTTAIRQSYQNHNIIKRREHNNIIGGSDSFTVIGNSGIGKSSAINNAISLISGDRLITVEEPFSRIIPCAVVQCPYDCSVKGMLLEILRIIDEILKTDHYEFSLRSKATTDMLIGEVSQICMNHIGLLVIDEIQNVVSSKNGSNLISALTQLINNSGISICFVGTPECNSFFDKTSYLARRTIGLQYSTSSYDSFFVNFCKTVFNYQYTKKTLPVSDMIIEWLYEHSAGIFSNVIALVHDAQEIAILNKTEILDIKNLNLAYEERLGMLQSYIRPSIIHTPQTSCIKKPKTSRPNKKLTTSIKMPDFSSSIKDIIQLHKKDNTVDYLGLLKEKYVVEEIEI